MKILLIGKTGQLGGSILSEKTRHQVFAPDRAELDIESKESCVSVVKKFQPDVIINTAAFHNVPQCELEPRRAFEVNCLAVRELALLCRGTGARLITFSTDYVFGGEKRVPYQESDRTHPLQVYGISKLAGELAALAVAPGNTVIIRTCGLYGMSGASSKGGNFVDKRIEDAQTNTELEIGSDQVVSPTNTVDLARAVLELIEHPDLDSGIYHLVNEGECNWFQFTGAIYELNGQDINLHPIDRGGMSGKMRRPLYSVMGNNKARAMGVILPHWRDALKRYIGDKYGSDGKI